MRNKYILVISFESVSLIFLAKGFLFLGFKFVKIGFKSKILGSQFEHMQIQEYHANDNASLYESNHRYLVDGQLAGMSFDIIINNLHLPVNSHRVQYHE